MDIAKLLEMINELLVRMAVFETKQNILIARHNITEGWFVEFVILILGAFGLVTFWLSKRK